MTWNRAFIWTFLWWTTLAASLPSVFGFHRLYTMYTNVSFGPEQLATHLFWTWAALAFLFHLLLSNMGISWSDFLGKMVPAAWLGLWCLIVMVINTEFPYGTAFWLLIVSTLGFSIPKLLTKSKK